MSEKSVTLNVSSLGSTLLQIAFIILKLTGMIDWRWVWVLAPLWISAACALIFLALALYLYLKGAYR